MAGITGSKEVLELSGYLKNMSSRLQSLEKTADQISNHIDEFTSNVKSKKEALTKDLDGIKKEISNIKEEVRSVQKAILQIIEQLKTSIKVEELERFKKRMDLWGPESLVTRGEVERVIKKI